MLLFYSCRLLSPTRFKSAKTQCNVLLKWMNCAVVYSIGALLAHSTATAASHYAVIKITSQYEEIHEAPGSILRTLECAQTSSHI